jgi:hypothetical protein
MLSKNLGFTLSTREGRVLVTGVMT